MKLEDCKDLKIGDRIKIQSAGGMEVPSTIVRFDYKAVWYRYLDDETMEPKKAMYYDIIGKITDEEVKAVRYENNQAKKFKMPKCPGCKKPIDKCKCED